MVTNPERVTLIAFGSVPGGNSSGVMSYVRHAMCSHAPPPLRKPQESSAPLYLPQGLQVAGLVSSGHFQFFRR